MKKNILLTLPFIISSQCYGEVPETVFNTLKTNGDYWTSEKIATATPMELPSISAEEYHSLFNDAHTNSESENGSAGKDADRRMLSEYGIPEKADMTKQPFRTAGKIYFTDDSGSDKYCSAQFVKNENTLLTAGHCIRNAITKKWYSNFVFYPKYSNGSAGTKIGWQCATTWSSYTNEVPGWAQNWAKDYGIIYTSAPSQEGFLGYRINNSTSTITAIGYPGNFGGGQYLMRVTGSRGAASDGVVEMTDNPIKSGSSGGAWIIDLNGSNTEGNNVVGINSFYYFNKPNSEYSPTFNKKFNELLMFGSNKCSY